MPAATPTPTEAGSRRRDAFLAVLAYLAFGLLLPLVPRHLLRYLAPWELAVLLILPTALFMLLQLWLAWTLVRLTPNPKACAVLTLGAVLLWFLTQVFVHPLRHAPLTVNFPLALLRPLLMGLWVTLAGTFGGVLLSRIVRERNVLLPVAVVAMPIDYIGAMTPIGYTHDAVQHTERIVHAVSVPVPVIGGLPLHVFIGPGDVLFIAFFFAAILRLAMNGRGTFWLMYVLLTLTLLYVFTPNSLPVAALVPMGLAVILANWTYFTLKREELFAMLYAGVLVLFLVVGFYLYSHHHLFHQ